MKLQKMGCAVLFASLAGIALGQGSASSVDAAGAPGRPKITGVSNLGIYASDPDKTASFFVQDLGAFKAKDPEDPAGTRFYFSPTQFIDVLPLPKTVTSINRLDHTGFNTSNAEGLRRYLGAHAVAVPAAVTSGADGSRYFYVVDPEGNRIEFVQPPAHLPSVPLNPLSHHIIHVGNMVHTAATEDAFYRDLLGFRPYWHGGSKEGVTDWISLQVPDGTDWIEYMMVSGPEKIGIPPSMKQQSLGSMDHFSLGVPNMEQTADVLYIGDRLSPRHSPMQMGRDGKWQLNLFAPDETRVEFMEFQPIMQPCCSPFLLPSPTH